MFLKAKKQYETRSIPVVIDKSHLVTIGEKLYAEKMSFLRELVNNAYDADAGEVRLSIITDKVVIKDNGSGMDEDGLRQYFTIGSPFKKENEYSPKFKRRRIGEFGIGKFAALAASNKFEIETQKGGFRARLEFDKEAWSLHEDWHLNIEIIPEKKDEDGTTISLHNVNIHLAPGNIRRYLAERVPIHDKNFSVFLNDEKITDVIASGRKIPIKIKTGCGNITGDLVIANQEQNRAEKSFGIAVMVRGVLVKYETFGLERARKLGARRITGRLSADWLPITSSRDEFIKESPEFECFSAVVAKKIKQVLASIRQEHDYKADLRASRVLKDALVKIGRALKNHQGFFPQASLPLGNPEENSTELAYKVTKAKFSKPKNKEIPKNSLVKLASAPPLKPKQRRKTSGTKSVARTLKIGSVDIAVRMEHLGQDEESLRSGGIIVVNIDHPLYRQYEHNSELLTMHIARVITKELALQTDIQDARAAFNLQSELLSEAFKK